MAVSNVFTVIKIQPIPICNSCDGKIYYFHYISSFFGNENFYSLPHLPLFSLSFSQSNGKICEWCCTQTTYKHTVRGKREIDDVTSHGKTIFNNEKTAQCSLLLSPRAFFCSLLLHSCMSSGSSSPNGIT